MKKISFNILISVLALVIGVDSFAQTPSPATEPEIKLPETAPVAAPSATAPVPSAPAAAPVATGEKPAVDTDLAIKNANGMSSTGRPMPINPTILVNAANGIAPPDAAGVATNVPNNAAAPTNAPVPTAVGGQGLPQATIGGEMVANQNPNMPGVNPGAVPAPQPKKPYKIFEGKDATQLNTDIKSVMFDRSLLPGFYKKVLQSKLDFGSSKSSNSSGDMVPEANTVPTSVTAPVFRLSTVLIPEDQPESWSVWINGKRRRNIDPAADGLEILKVTKTSITAQFQNKDIGLMSPDIETKLKKVEDPIWDYQSEKGDIKYSVIKGLVEFTIKLSQTFIVYDMKIIEGTAEPTTVNLRTEEDSTADSLIDKVKDVGDGLLDNSDQPKPVEVVPNN